MAKLIGPGPLPAAYGKISIFGGVDDDYKNERMQNLSYTDFYPFEKLHGKGSYAVLAYLNSIGKNKPNWFRAMFTKDKRADAIASLNPKYGLFAYLNEGALYCAGRWDNDKYKKLLDDKNPWVTFTNPETKKKITLLRLDWGPHVNTGRAYDLSPMGAQLIGAKNNSFVSAQYATPAEIEKAKKYQMDLWENGMMNTLAYKDMQKTPSKHATSSMGDSSGFIFIFAAIAAGLLVAKGGKR